jgi:hypothetical protein
MIYTPMTNKAIKLMFELHKDQTDRSGLPYVFHPWHVAESMDDEASTIVALLHDSVEDTDITLEELRAMGFSDDVVSALDLMTHRDGVDYFDYVKKLASCPLARKVKLADLKHNSDTSRLEKVTDNDLKRAEKYKKAIEYLEGLQNTRYYLLWGKQLGKREGTGSMQKDYLFENGKWVPDNNCLIMDHLAGYDPREPICSEERFGNPGILDDIEEITEEEAMAWTQK